jgi:hypothetical protein
MALSLSRMILTASVLLLLDASSAAGAPDRYASTSDRLETIGKSEHIAVEKIGHSLHDRPLYSVAVMPTDTQRMDTVPRVVVISGQHGNEQTPVSAMLKLLGDEARGRSLPGDILLVFVPVANPDGFARIKRANSKSIDLNRNWNAPDQPETTAIASLIEQFQPDVIIDLHEWATQDSYKPSCVEIAGFGDGPQHRLARILASRIQMKTSNSSVTLNAIHYSHGSDPRLAHRWYTEQGICGMLIETSPDSPLEAREAAYTQAVTAVLEALSDGKPAVMENLAAMRDGKAAENVWVAALCARTNASPVTQPAHSGLWLIVVFGAIYLAVRIACRRKNEILNDGLRRRNPVRLRTLSTTEAVRFDLPVHARIALLHTFRTRPSDRS